MPNLTNQELFNKLYCYSTEKELDNFIGNHPEIFKNENWAPIGKNESNFSIIENQQSNPIAALVEKVTNSIDATLMKRCIETGIDAKSKDAPKSMDEAVQSFYPDYKNWDLNTFRRQQAEEIQIIADGPTKNSAVIIYDNGEGQHPENFEDTFLSLMKGNKNEIHFVQGKYNMGGSGAIVFCGTKGYQLIGSKRFDGTGKFGFTLVIEHPLSKSELETKKNTWYEFLKINEEIPAFDISELDLNLLNRKFKTGTVIKMYSEKSFDKIFNYKRNYVETYKARKTFLKDPKLYFSTITKLPTNEKAIAFKLLQQSGVNTALLSIPTNKLQLTIKAINTLKKGIGKAIESGSIGI